LHFELPVLGSQLLHCNLHFELPVLGSQLLHCNVHFTSPGFSYSVFRGSLYSNIPGFGNFFMSSCTLQWQSWRACVIMTSMYSRSNKSGFLHPDMGHAL